MSDLKLFCGASNASWCVFFQLARCQLLQSKATDEGFVSSVTQDQDKTWITPVGPLVLHCSEHLEVCGMRWNLIQSMVDGDIKGYTHWQTYWYPGAGTAKPPLSRPSVLAQGPRFLDRLAPLDLPALPSSCWAWATNGSPTAPPSSSKIAPASGSFQRHSLMDRFF